MSNAAKVQLLRDLKTTLLRRDHEYDLHLEKVSEADQWTDEMMEVYAATVGGVLALIDEYIAALGADPDPAPPCGSKPCSLVAGHRGNHQTGTTSGPPNHAPPSR